MLKTNQKNSYEMERLSTVVLALTSLDPDAFDNANIIFFFTKQANLMRRSIALSHPFQLPGLSD
jgi:hypothetical protein